MARILLGVSGGIAAYKSWSGPPRHGGRPRVRVAMTEAASRFVGPASFEGITGAPVLTSEFERDPLRGAFPGDPQPEHDPIGHLEVAANCDAYLIAPASANTLAKLAAGLADSMLTTSFLACTAPRLVAPAMNGRMYTDHCDPGEPGNAARARRHGDRAGRGPAGLARGVRPRTASRPRAGCWSASRRCCPPGSRPWDGLRVLVTAGGTREPIDPVRFLGNRSSGRMGFALATAGARRGAEVTLIAANVSLPTPSGVRRASTWRPPRGAWRGVPRRVPSSPGAPDGRGAGRLPSQRGGRRQAEARRGPSTSTWSPPRTSSPPSPRPAAPGRRSSASRPSTARGVPGGLARSSPRKNADLIVLNDVSDPAIGFESTENAATLISSTERDHARASPQGRR